MVPVVVVLVLVIIINFIITLSVHTHHLGRGSAMYPDWAELSLIVLLFTAGARSSLVS